MVIGPEGDFSPQEVELAVGSGLQQVALGTTILRAETAAVVAAAMLKLI
jgi:16S rRNA (uracil1498-N3)-methyltransferase